MAKNTTTVSPASDRSWVPRIGSLNFLSVTATTVSAIRHISTAPPTTAIRRTPAPTLPESLSSLARNSRRRAQLPATPIAWRIALAGTPRESSALTCAARAAISRLTPSCSAAPSSAITSCLSDLRTRSSPALPARM